MQQKDSVINNVLNEHKNSESLVFREHNNLDRAGLSHYFLSEYKFPF